MRNTVKLLAAVILLSLQGGYSAAASSVENTSAESISLGGAYSSLSSTIAAQSGQNEAYNQELKASIADIKAAGGNSLSASNSYLQATNGLKGEALFQKLHELTDTSKISSYNSAKSYMYATADHVTVHGNGGVLDAYSQVFLEGSGGNGGAYSEQGDENQDGVVDKGVNAEHSWPQSFFKEALPMKADLHHLQTTLITPNGRRGNLPYGTVTNPTYTTSGGSKLGKGVFEPCDADKGNTARAILYFVTRYYDRNIRSGAFSNDAFWKGKVDLFLQWNRQDPPDEAERTRNDLVEKFQGNRNPFIDDPTLADRVGADVFKSH